MDIWTYDEADWVYRAEGVVSGVLFGGGGVVGVSQFPFFIFTPPPRYGKKTCVQMA